MTLRVRKLPNGFLGALVILRTASTSVGPTFTVPNDVVEVFVRTFGFPPSQRKTTLWEIDHLNQRSGMNCLPRRKVSTVT